MLTKLMNKMLSQSVPGHAGLTGLAFAVFMGVKSNLDRLYVKSGHPVDYATGQLAFDGGKIAGYYDSMRAGGTFGVYVQTQLFDFLFIASVIALGVCLGTLIARLDRSGSIVRKLGLGVAVFALVGGSFDALENLISFAMMQFETGIPQALALLYSGFAALKFGSLTCAMLLTLAGLGAAAISAVWGSLREASAS